MNQQDLILLKFFGIKLSPEEKQQWDNDMEAKRKLRQFKKSMARDYRMWKYLNKNTDRIYQELKEKLFPESSL